MKKGAYIGVTGFMSRAEVDAAVGTMRAESTRLLMVGVLASAKNVFRQEEVKFPNRYPNVGAYRALFCDSPRVLNLIHFATDDPPSLFVHFARLCIRGGRFLDGFQLNMVWPDPARIRDQFFDRDMRVVLQIGRQAALRYDNDPDKIARAIDPYKGVVTDILFDESGGKGVPFNGKFATRCLQFIRDRHPDLGLGIAGGLSGSTVRRLEPIVSEFPEISIDAEGGLRTKRDHLDLEKVQAYLTEAQAKLCP